MEASMITDRVWIEMPAVGSGVSSDPVRPKYAVHGHALLLHREGKVYVVFRDERDHEEMVKQADCRPLTLAEGRAFEESLPFPNLPQLLPGNLQNGKRNVALGDVVSWLTRRAGITEGSACQQRKRWLNRIVVWGWWRH
jgi:hypothetical protein